MLLLCLSLMLTSGKIKKEVHVGKSDCTGVGFNCTPEKGGKIEATYVFDEPQKGNLSMQFSLEDVKQNAALLQSFRNVKEFVLEEDMLLPAEVLRAMNLPSDTQIPKGRYSFSKNDAYFIIKFLE